MESLILSIVTTIIKAVFVSEKKKYRNKKFENKITRICIKNFSKYIETSLNTEEFLNYMETLEFYNLTRNYFCTFEAVNTKQEYIEFMCLTMKEVCPNVNKEDYKNYLIDVEKTYFDSLLDIINADIQLKMLLTIITKTNRNLIEKITVDLSAFKKYLNTIKIEKIDKNDKLINRFHEACEKGFANISFSGISGAEYKTAKSMDSLYVKNTFSIYGSKELILGDCKDDNIKLNIDDFFRFNSKIVILGGAGYGKTTTLNYIYNNYENLYSDQKLKLKINLKDYAIEIIDHNKTIIDCFVNEFKKRLNPASTKRLDLHSILGNLLEEGSCFLIFDALDEIPYQNHRDKIRDELQSFCDLYYLNRVIITSREIGYLRNQFDEDFLHLKINIFDEKQIKEYTMKWVKLNCPEDTSSISFYKHFEREVSRSRSEDLISNPIILVLALIIFDSTKQLPSRRVEFYQRCIETFLITRESHKNKDIVPDEKTNSILIDTLLLPKVAHDLFEIRNNNEDYSFTKENLLESIFQAIEVSDRNIWRNAVTNYMKYLTERAELIMENDENKFDFAHKSFYEYFLALYFAKNLSTAELEEKLSKWIGDSNLDELARLIIEVIIHKNDGLQHSDIMKFMIQKSVDDSDSQAYAYALILFSLYENRMMLPKFYKDFHESIIKKPRILDYIIRPYRRPIRANMISDTEAHFDEDILAKMINDVVKNSKDDKEVIELLFYVSKFYNENQLIIEDELFLNIFRDFKTVSVFTHMDRKKPGNFKKMYDYYTSDINYMRINKSEYMFLFIVQNLVNSKEEIVTDFSKILDFHIERNRVLNLILTADDFIRLADKSFASPEWFVIFLLSTTRGSYSPLGLIEFLCRSTDRFRRYTSDILADENLEKRINVFLTLIRKKKGFEEYINAIKRFKVFDDKYMEFYTDSFEIFCERLDEEDDEE